MPPESKILVRTPNWIGDHVMAIPFYSSLRNAYPDSKITFLAPESMQEFDDAPYRDSKVILTSGERKFGAGFLQKARKLRLEKFDLSISLPSSWSSALFLYLIGAKSRVGFTAEGNELMFDTFLPWKGKEAGKHKSALYLSLLEHLTAHSFAPVNAVSPIHATKEKLLVLAPGASLPLREYPYFSELLLSLCNAYPQYKIIILGGQREEKYKTQIKRLNLGNVEDHIGKTSLKDVIEICKKARLVISNDSGIAHLSATLAGSDTFVLMGPGDPDYILPTGGKAIAIRLGNLPCSPCEKSYCRAAYGYQACLKGLLPEVILDKMKTLTL